MTTEILALAESVDAELTLPTPILQAQSYPNNFPAY